MNAAEQYRQIIQSKLNSIERVSQHASSLDERLDITNLLLLELIKSVNGLNVSPTVLATIQQTGGSVSGIPVTLENPPFVVARKLVVDTASTGKNFPKTVVPFDFGVVIVAIDTNVNTVYIGNSKAESEDTSQSFPLSPGKGIEYRVHDISQLWICSASAGDGVYWTVEQWEAPSG